MPYHQPRAHVPAVWGAASAPTALCLRRREGSVVGTSRDHLHRVQPQSTINGDTTHMYSGVYHRTSTVFCDPLVASARSTPAEPANSSGCWAPRSDTPVQ